MSMTKLAWLKSAAEQIYTTARDEGRGLSADEKVRFDGYIEQGRREKESIEFGRAISSLGGSEGEGSPGGSLSTHLKSAGLDPRAGKLRVQVELKAALGVTAQPSTSSPYLYDRLPKGDADEDGLGYSDFTIGGTGAVSGDIERDPVGSAEKATVDRTVTWVQGQMSQIALIINGLPTAVFEASAFSAYADGELRWRISRAIDEHVVAAIEAANPPSGEEGEDLIAQIRNGIAAMRDVGSNASILVVDPATGASLDLTKSTGGSEEYLFPPRATGSASPLFNMGIVEVTGATSPILVDPERLGAVRLGRADFLVDPFTNFSTNLVNLRMEALASMHVRNPEGAYIIATGS